MSNKILFYIIFICCSFSMFSQEGEIIYSSDQQLIDQPLDKPVEEPVVEEKKHPIEFGFSVCTYYNFGGFYEESDDWVDNVQQGIDLLAGFRVGGLIHGGYRFTDEMVSGLEIGYLTYPIKEISLNDIPIRAYLKFGPDWFNIKGFGGLLYRKSYYYRNDILTPVSEWGYDIGARIESTIFYLELAYSSSFADKLDDITRFGAGISLTFDLN